MARFTWFLPQRIARGFLVAVAALGALVLFSGPANAAPAVLAMDGGSSRAQMTCTTLVTSPVSTVAQGAPVTLTAMVTPAAATGKVQFKDSAKDLGTVAVTNGTAATMVMFSEAGARSLTAMFIPADSAFSTSTSPAVSLTVTNSSGCAACAAAAQPATQPQPPAQAQAAPVMQAAPVQQQSMPMVLVEREGLVGTLVGTVGDLF